MTNEYWDLCRPSFTCRRCKVKEAKQYKLRNKERTRAVARAYAAKVRKENPHLRMDRTISRAVSKCIKGEMGGLRHLPYTKEQLRTHLQSKFVEGMTWENYGSAWHVDHIIPKSSFKMSGKPDCAEFQRCWALENLQPLWAKDNLSKGNRLNASS